MVAEVKFSALSGKTGVICDQIERRLASGHYGFGEEIYTQDLVKEFGASRAPVTAALSFLRASGYLIITPQVGCRVISPTVSDIQDFFAVYGRVEGTMAGFAALRHHGNELEGLRDIQKQIQRNTPGKGEKISNNFVNLVADFHARIHSMAHSEMEARRADSYWRMSEFYLFNGTRMRPSGEISLAVSDRQRAAIVNAIEVRDEDLARSLMEEHMLGKPGRVGARGTDSP
jgi:DNA-binding GntR family transcriptional regulator